MTEFIFTTLWAYSADDKLMIFFLFFPRKHKNFSGKNKNYLICYLMKILPRVLSINGRFSVTIHKGQNFCDFLRAFLYFKPTLTIHVDMVNTSSPTLPPHLNQHPSLPPPSPPCTDGYFSHEAGTKMQLR